MTASGAFIRDPLYGDIFVSGAARALIDTPAYQRLRRIRQLGQATVVYPAAMHTRFEHALGVYFMAGEAIRTLRDRGELSGISDEECELVRIACLAHDLGHYPAAHFLEEYGLPGADHEEAGASWFSSGDIAEAMAGTGIPHASEQVAALVAHRSPLALQGIVSGAADADKIDYIARDAYHCGLAVGFDRHTLIGSLAMVENPQTGRREVGITERGLPAFEQMLFAKFALYRMVYFHETTRSATVMMRKLIVAALQAGILQMRELLEWTDEEVFLILRSRVEQRSRAERPQIVAQLGEALTNRRLYVPAASLPLRRAPRLTPDRLAHAEQVLAERLGLRPGEVLLDIPHRPNMLSTDILVRRTSGEVVRADALTPDDGFALNAAGEALYHASGRMTIFTARPVATPPARILDDLAALVAAPGPAPAAR